MRHYLPAFGNLQAGTSANESAIHREVGEWHLQKGQEHFPGVQPQAAGEDKSCCQVLAGGQAQSMHGSPLEECGGQPQPEHLAQEQTRNEDEEGLLVVGPHAPTDHWAVVVKALHAPASPAIWAQHVGFMGSFGCRITAASLIQVVFPIEVVEKVAQIRIGLSVSRTSPRLFMALE